MNTGQPARTPIYFAVDFDSSNLQIAGTINDYFRGVAHGFNAVGSDNPAYDVADAARGTLADGYSLISELATRGSRSQRMGWIHDVHVLEYQAGGPVQSRPFDFDTNDAKPTTAELPFKRALSSRSARLQKMQIPMPLVSKPYFSFSSAVVLGAGISNRC